MTDTILPLMNWDELLDEFERVVTNAERVYWARDITLYEKAKEDIAAVRQEIKIRIALL